MLRSHPTLFVLLRRILDVVILLGVTFLAEKRFGQTDLMRIMAIYCSILMIIIFSLFNMYKSWRGVSVLKEIKTLLIAWVSVLVI
ncbi:MAG: hypothetical protein JW801_18910, partial [Bacteroidales bacterium]|nr:hypothetical protein [Bacteroidales bacterium]